MYSVFSRLTVFLFLFFFSIAPVSGQSKTPAYSNGELKECIKTVETYCQAWMSKDYDAMHALLSIQGMGKQEKDKFSQVYGNYANKGGTLTSYTVDPTATVNQQNNNDIIVKVDLKFVKEIKPRIVQGTHTFVIVKDEGVWKIKYVIPPIAPPKLEQQRPAGGSKPGE
jgi:hypothetical protein